MYYFFLYFCAVYGFGKIIEDGSSRFGEWFAIFWLGLLLISVYIRVN